jgi:nitroimidazol reductase NimA-like FMN-containing flavoprotein (pyridoxamine 5'-phosphate oxidase superfamily)
LEESKKLNSSTKAIQLLNGQAAQKLMDSERVMRMAYIGMDGYPRAIPVGYLWKQNFFVVCTAENAPKLAALKANPKWL